MSILELAFPYKQAIASPIVLNKFILTDENDSHRLVATLSEREGSPGTKYCSSIAKLLTDTQQPTGDLITYIQNPSSSATTPLLLSVAPNFNKFKLNISIKTSNLEEFESKSLIILKALDDNDNTEVLKKSLDEKSSYNSNSTEISRLPYSNFPISKTSEHEFQKIIVNDSFNSSIFQDNVLNVSLWEVDGNDIDDLGGHKHLFSFKYWVNEVTASLESNAPHEVESEHALPPLPAMLPPVPPKHAQESPVSNEASTKAPAPAESKGLDKLTFSNIRNAFNFNIEDGPEFRHTLQGYEKNIPLFKRNCYALLEELRKLDTSLDRIKQSKVRILEYIAKLAELQAFKPILNEIFFVQDFKVKFLAIFDTFEVDLKNFLANVCDHKLLIKVFSNLPLDSNSSSTSSAPASTTSPGDLAKKQFESNSKEYYNWLNKYLSNEKERPELKLLVKRKSFELSKLDYLNFLNLCTNNQYFNQLLENLFKYSSREKPLEFKYELYLNLLSRFNSEKLLLRQSIEACQSNEELTTILRNNLLNHSSTPNSPSMIDNELVTSLSKIDSIFAIDGNNVTAVPIRKDDQNSEIAGILYTLGGQGKQGWHKEWVVLSKGRLIEYSDWRKGRQPINKPIEIALSNIKPTSYDKRKNCFEILTSRGTKHVFQAINQEERDNWIRGLYNAGQLVDTSRLKDKTNGQSTGPSKSKILHALDASNIKKTILHSDADNISPISIIANSPLSKNENIDYLQLVRVDSSNENNICSDCGLLEAVEWVSLNFLTIFCLRCSSGHRNLGSHVSRIKSLKLDNFKGEIEFLLKHVSNKRANQYLEENLPKFEKISANASNEKRLEFIKQKYSVKKYASKYLSQDELNDNLVLSIQKINIPDTVKYIGCGADINMKLSLNLNKNDFIKITLLEYSLRKYVEVNDTPPKKLFVISELLVINGCKVDGLKETNKEIKLTDEAIEWWKQRSSKLLGE